MSIIGCAITWRMQNSTLCGVLNADKSAPAIKNRGGGKFPLDFLFRIRKNKEGSPFYPVEVTPL